MTYPTLTLTGTHALQDGRPSRGRVTIAERALTFGGVVYTGPLSCDLDASGSWSIDVLHPSAPGVNPSGLGITVEVDLLDDDVTNPRYSIRGIGPEVTTLDVADVVPAVQAPGIWVPNVTGVVEGPPGPEGPAGPAGPAGPPGESAAVYSPTIFLPAAMGSLLAHDGPEVAALSPAWPVALTPLASLTVSKIGVESAQFGADEVVALRWSGVTIGPGTWRVMWDSYSVHWLYVDGVKVDVTYLYADTIDPVQESVGSACAYEFTVATETVRSFTIATSGSTPGISALWLLKIA